MLPPAIIVHFITVLIAMTKTNAYIPPVEAVMDIFRQLNNIPRPSHHEEKVADFLCDFARKLGLEYRRDDNNCVVIRKPAGDGRPAHPDHHTL